MNRKIVGCFKHCPDGVFFLNFPTLFKTLLEFHFSCIGAMGLLGQTQAATEWFMLIVWGHPPYSSSHPILCSTTGVPVARVEGCLELVHVCGQSLDALFQSQDHEKGCPRGVVHFIDLVTSHIPSHSQGLRRKEDNVHLNFREL